MWKWLVVNKTMYLFNSRYFTNCNMESFVINKSDFTNSGSWIKHKVRERVDFLIIPCLSISLHSTNLRLPPQREGKNELSWWIAFPLFHSLLHFSFFPSPPPYFFPCFRLGAVTEIPHGFLQGPGSLDEAVSSVMDDVLITVSSTLDRWRRGEEENWENQGIFGPPFTIKKKKMWKKKKNNPPPPQQCFSPIYLSDTNRVSFIASKCLGTSKGTVRQTEKAQN